jgi:hypothetical protein
MDVDMEDKDPQSKRQGFHNWTLFLFGAMGVEAIDY